MPKISHCHVIERKRRAAKPGAVMSAKNVGSRTRTAGRRLAKGPQAAEAHVWELPDEKPGTLEEIFGAEDGRRGHLIFSEISKRDGFRMCWQAIRKSGDPDDLVLAVMACINVHLHPQERHASIRRGLQIAACRAEEAAKALEALATVLSRDARERWVWHYSVAGLPDPTDPRLAASLGDMVTVFFKDLLTSGAFKDQGGRSKMAAFRVLVRRLARVFEQATGSRATVTRNHHKPEGYGGRFLDLVEIVRPIAAAIIETSKAGSLAHPATKAARGKFIEEVLKKRRTEKTRSVSK